MNRQGYHFIKAETLPMPGPKDVPPSWQVPVGTIALLNTGVAPHGWMACKGQFVKVDDYIELFKAIGHTYSPPPFVERKIKNGWLRRLFRLECKTERVANPAFDPNWFNLPDLRNQTIVQRE